MDIARNLECRESFTTENFCNIRFKFASIAIIIEMVIIFVADKAIEISSFFAIYNEFIRVKIVLNRATLWIVYITFIAL